MGLGDATSEKFVPKGRKTLATYSHQEHVAPVWQSPNPAEFAKYPAEGVLPRAMAETLGV